jgi:8-oxo-dGTP diphosphatase
MAMPTHIVGVAGIVEHADGKILLVKTSTYGWVYPGGQVEVGENLVDALVREIREESGIEAAVTDLIGVYSNTGTYLWHDGITTVPTKVVLDFRCRALGGVLGTSDETSVSAWVAREQALGMISHPTYRTRYQAYLDFNGRVSYMEYVSAPQFVLKLQRKI